MDRIDLLESKVTEMIGMVQRLHGENESLRAQLAAANDKAASLSDERHMLDQERSVVRDRIEQLLGDIEGVTNQAEMAAPVSPAVHAVAPESSDPTTETASASESNEAKRPWSDNGTPNTEGPRSFRAMVGGRQDPETAPESPSQDGNHTPINPVLPGLS